jgi:hypothetical protein
MPARVETSICRLVPAVSVVIRSARNGSWPDINDRSSCSVACESTPLIRPLTPNQAGDERPRRRSPIPSGSGGLRRYRHRCCHGDIRGCCSSSRAGFLSAPKTLGVDQTCLAGRSALTGLSGMSAFCWRTHLMALFVRSFVRWQRCSGVFSGSIEIVPSCSVEQELQFAGTLLPKPPEAGQTLPRRAPL